MIDATTCILNGGEDYELLFTIRQDDYEKLRNHPDVSFIGYMKEKVRVASGQGFWGDLLTAPVEQVRGGQIDYLMLDYLAEVTMSIVQKQRQRDPNAGRQRREMVLDQEPELAMD